MLHSKYLTQEHDSTVFYAGLYFIEQDTVDCLPDRVPVK